MEQSKEEQREFWNQLTKRRDLVGGTLVEYQRGVEVARDEIRGSRIQSGYLPGFSPGIGIIGKNGRQIFLSMMHSKIQKRNGVYKIICQPDGFDTFEVAIAPNGVGIHERKDVCSLCEDYT